jgi:hypothetical protein
MKVGVAANAHTQFMAIRVVYWLRFFARRGGLRMTIGFARSEMNECRSANQFKHLAFADHGDTEFFGFVEF